MALNRSLHERCGQVIAAVRSAATGDAGLSRASMPMVPGGTDNGVRGLISKLEAAGTLAPGLATIQAGH